jgi:PadR family transcriptional regulator PadR
MKPRQDPSITFQSLRVLQAFALDPAREMSGAALLVEAGVPSGTLYPILLRFEEAGWLRGRWETSEPDRAGRPNRKVYRITGSGLAKATESRQEWLGGLTT